MITARRPEARGSLVSQPRQTPGRTERSQQRVGEEQPTVLVCETFDRVGQAFAQRRQQASTRSHTGEAEKTVFHKIMFVKETVVHE